MNTLAIDTSNKIMGVAILKNKQIIGEMITNLDKNQTSRIMPAIDNLMREVNIRPKELDQIVVAKGPGSYTGVRIGLTTAKTMAWSLNIPVIGVSSLEVLAYQGRLSHSYICPFFDARRDNIYTGLYKWEDNKLIMVDPEENISMKEWLEKIVTLNQPILFLSPDLINFKEIIADKLGKNAIFPESPYHISRPSHLALAGLDKPVDDVHTLTPNYLRMAEAETNWLKTQKGNNADET